MILEITGMFDTADVEAALDDLAEHIARRVSEGHDEAAYEIALLVMAEGVCDANEPTMN